jgi:carbon monoxide dehydrogenase subunit G
MHVERTFTVTREVEAVFDYLSDFTHTTEWDPGTVSTIRTSGDGGVGTTYDNTSRFMGRTVDLTYETVAHERPTHVEFRGTTDSATTKDSMTFSRAGDLTRVHYRADFDFGRLGNLVAPLLLRRKLDRLADETVAQLEKALAG